MDKEKSSQVEKILLEGNYVSKQDFEKAESYAKKSGTSVLDYLLSKGVVTRDLLGQAIAESLKVSYIDLANKPLTKESVLKIPEAIAKKFMVVMVSESDAEVMVASSNPLAAGLKEELTKVFSGKNLKIGYALQEEIQSLFKYYQQPLETRFSKILEAERRVAPEIINEIFNDALLFKASDIHFEPGESEVIIRFRVDGVLREAGRIKKEFYPNILNRIKVLANLRIDEHFITQDGAIRFQGKQGIVDMRISLVPTVNGEKVALRLLAQYVKAFALSDLGLSEKDKKALNKAVKKPFGMVIVAGPTGSGKTTTLHAILRLINNPEINITTIEDPVEYKIPGVNHIQVNPGANLTFAKGLRSIVRQDSDVILVGEIRDRETAEIAVNAALTGHLLFSSFHANDAATVIPRLLEMKIEPFLISSTLEIIIAQRLARKICDSCKYSYQANLEKLAKKYKGLEKYLEGVSPTFYKGKGCKACNESGYLGRTGIFEFIVVTREMKNLILRSPSAEEIWNLAQKEGSRSLFHDGLEKARSGVTTLEEIMRVTPPEV